jgi:hypothetical protein
MGTSRARLLNAALVLLTLDPRDFTDDATRLRFSSLRDTLSAVEGKGDEGSFEATISRLSDEQIKAALYAICDLDRTYRPLWFFVDKTITDQT